MLPWWPVAEDSQTVNSLEVFTDGSSTLSESWPPVVVAAGWGAVLVGREIGGEQFIIGGAAAELADEDLAEQGLQKPTAPCIEVAGMRALLVVMRLAARDVGPLPPQFRVYTLGCRV